MKLQSKIEEMRNQTMREVSSEDCVFNECRVIDADYANILSLLKEHKINPELERKGTKGKIISYVKADNTFRKAVIWAICGAWAVMMIVHIVIYLMRR